MRYDEGMNMRFAVLISRFPTGELAKKLEMSRATVSQWKSALKLPQAANYARIAKASGLSVDEIANAVAQDHIERVQSRARLKAAKHFPLSHTSKES
jgi:transcriptional regulator with XRE-family HTH domain